MTELVYKKVLGFPARHEKEEFCWTMNRAASLDFRRARDIVKKFEKVRNEGAREGRKVPLTQRLAAPLLSPTGSVMPMMTTL